MTYYAIGGEMNSITSYSNVGSNPVADSTTLAATNVRGGIAIPLQSGSTADVAFIDPSTGATLTSSTGLNNFWTAFNMTAIITFGAHNSSFVEWRDATGTAYIRLAGTANDNIAVMQYWNGTAWVALTNTFTISSNANVRYDFQFALTNPGVCNVFYNNTLVASPATSIDLSALPKLVSMRFYSLAAGNNGNPNWGSWIVSDTTTREHQVLFRGPTGNGAEQQWTGDYTNIDEFPEAQSDIIYTGTAAQASTFTHAAFTFPTTGLVVKAVAIGAWMRIDPAGGPQNAKLRLTIGGTDYDKSVFAPSINYYGRYAIWGTDPSTGSAWNGLTNVNGAFGVLSQA